MTALCRAPTLTFSGGEREASKMWCSRIGSSSPRVAAVSSALGVSSSAAAVELLPCGGREESAAAVDEVGGMLAMPHVPRGNGDGRTLSMGSIVDHRRKVRPPEPRGEARLFVASPSALFRQDRSPLKQVAPRHAPRVSAHGFAGPRQKSRHWRIRGSMKRQSN